ncbi:MAG: hypothetical protein BGP12_06300 [Rhodospirillales bacterium 70-18]|nr:hypothetical protein [Rhodospirillales bacterium]OJY77037.1 MAG: hypothetical protein BGP12_06300 [Rhodospirillales bacterium 70-18]
MTLFVDARVPVVFGPAELAGPEDALLLEAGQAAPAGAGPAVAWLAARAASHAVGCACCVPRGAVATALGGLFLARARGEVGFFRRVVAAVSDPAAVRSALAEDRLLAGRFRPG